MANPQPREGWFTQDDKDSPARTQLGRLRETVSVLDYIPERVHADIRYSVSTYDCTEAFQRAEAYATGAVFVPPGTYVITGTVTGDFYSFGNVTISGGTVTDIVDLTAPVTATGGTAARTLEARFGERLSVADFGTLGTGSDAAVIQAALDAVAAAGGGRLFVPEGTCLLAAAIEVPHLVWLEGAGMGATKMVATGTQDAVIKTKDRVGGLDYTSVTDMTITGTSEQLYGLLIRGVEQGRFTDLVIEGCTADNGSGGLGDEGAWGLYAASYYDEAPDLWDIPPTEEDDYGTRRKTNNCLFMHIYSTGNFNSISNASFDRTTSGMGGNNNTYIRCYAQGFLEGGRGFTLYGEANSYYACRANSNVNNVICFEVRDAVTLLSNPDGDSPFSKRELDGVTYVNDPVTGRVPTPDAPGDPGGTISSYTDEWGMPSGVRVNDNIGFMFYDTCSAIVHNPGGNGCLKRIHFESTTARGGVNITRPDLSLITPPVGGYVKNVTTPSGLDGTTNNVNSVWEHVGHKVRMNSSSANTFTLTTAAHPESAVAGTYHPGGQAGIANAQIGCDITIFQAGTGTTTIVAGSGCTITSRGSLMALDGRYSRGTLHKMTNTAWVLEGDLA